MGARLIWRRTAGRTSYDRDPVDSHQRTADAEAAAKVA